MSEQPEPWIDPALWDAALVPFKAVDLTPYLEGRPWVCTEEEQVWLDDLIRGFESFRPRWIGSLP